MRLLAVVMSRVRCCGRPIGIEHAAKAVEPAEKVTEVKSKDKNIAAAIEGNNLTMEEKKILGNHTEACLAGKDTYVDPVSGYSVFTSRSHLLRGKCCGLACSAPLSR
uniref:Uncharacterized protein LOC116938963 isoform X5 n=1 Tax=Petromyzon marinus TaxID=7757 RepID=A0AAJ7SPY7_PETMA|nr:uncharacterized protein LOC116938963 isoform X5 [Petromyzon marinus]